ncbi:hypothetical protein NUU61_008233 [Penicillium alfredii]|uniref:Uncharacterized protein n=1 Tax=Penicillium alfredii TaxID=1506179 RepID=A0A9W9JZB6_9EURO|nr:uncharacterized protein NUU61_008233 [Penicillium alfredii]KAJ5086926.1 hypothetical protein NUU61_008233 [Penicillium alfredii]
MFQEKDCRGVVPCTTIWVISSGREEPDVPIDSPLCTIGLSLPLVVLGPAGESMANMKMLPLNRLCLTRCSR